MDVVSLLPSATEIVCALGVEPVATSHECDHPSHVVSLPDATVAHVDGDGSSREIDEAVRRAVDGTGVFDVRADRLAELDPDLVITQGVCDVCAVDDVLVERVVADRGLDADVLTTDPHSLADLYDDVRRIGGALGREERAEELVADLRGRVADVAEATPDAEAGPTVAVLDWLDPVMVAGHWMPELVELAGARYPLAATGERSRPREWSSILEADPDVLVLAPCGFEVEQTIRNLSDVRDRPRWDDLAAVRDGRTYVFDGHHYVNRAGPRLVDTLEYLAGLLHPERSSTPPADVARPLAEVSEPAE